MASTFECPKCGRELKVPDELLGKKIKCPACQAIFITAAEEEAPRPAAPVPPEGVTPSRAAVQAREEERPRQRPRRWEDDYEEEEYGPRSHHRRAHSAVAAPANALLSAGIITCVVCTLFIAVHGVMFWIITKQNSGFQGLGILYIKRYPG